MRTTSQRRGATLLCLLALSAFCVALVLARMAYTGTGHYGNLLWNLFLAWVPFLLALVVYDGYRRRVQPAALVALSLAWLLFLPNAPYLVTEFVLLRSWHGAPIWFDGIMLTTFAWTGLLLGFVSLYLMQSVARRVVGPRLSWGGVVFVLGLSSVGIYLGRFLRWNSWDVLTRPAALGGEIARRLGDPLASPRPIAVTVMLTAFLTLAYFVLYTFLQLGLQEREER